MPKVIHTKHKLVSGRVLPTLLLPHFVNSMGVPLQGCHPSVFNKFRKHYSSKRIIGFPAIMCALITLLTPVISVATNYSSVFADSISTQEDFNFSVTVHELPTLKIDMPSSLNMDFTPNYEGYKSQVEPLEIKVSTSNATGYRLFMATEQPNLTADFTLTNGSRPTINSLSDTTNGYTEEQFSSQTNKWGYTLLSTHLTSSESGAVGKYVGLKDNSVLGDNPDSNFMELNYYNDGSKGDDPTTVGFAVNLDINQPAGTYNTSLKFIAVTRDPAVACPAYNICYNSNGAISTSSMGTQGDDSITSGSTVTLWANNFKNPTGYGFAGWSTTADYVANTTVYYGPNEDITAPDSISQNGLMLYANWIKADEDYTMQTFSQAVCDAKLNSGDVMALRDIRDDNTYAIAKLADGKCWMIENLRLGNYKTDGTTPTETLSSINTNVPTDWQGMKLNYGDANYQKQLSPSNDTAEYWCNDPDQASCYDQSRLNSNNTISPVNSLTDPKTQNVYSYGNYYNWYSATAGYGTQDNANTTQVGNTANYDINNNYSLCPASWKLPSGGNTGTGSSLNPAGTRNVTGAPSTFGDFYKLGYVLMGSNKTARDDALNNGYPYYSTGQINTVTSSYSGTFAGKSLSGLTATKVFRIYPNNFLFSGGQNSASTTNRGSVGDYWSSTARTTRNAYGVRLNASNVYPGTNYLDRYYGSSVRCLIGS